MNMVDANTSSQLNSENSKTEIQQEQIKTSPDKRKKRLFGGIDWSAETRRIEEMSEEEVAQPVNVERAQKMIERGVTSNINDALTSLRDIQLQEARLRFQGVNENNPKFIELLKQEGKMEEAKKRLENIQDELSISLDIPTFPEAKNSTEPTEDGASSIEEALQKPAVPFRLSERLKNTAQREKTNTPKEPDSDSETPQETIVSSDVSEKEEKFPFPQERFSQKTDAYRAMESSQPKISEEITHDQKFLDLFERTAWSYLRKTKGDIFLKHFSQLDEENESGILLDKAGEKTSFSPSQFLDIAGMIEAKDNASRAFRALYLNNEIPTQRELKKTSDMNLEDPDETNSTPPQSELRQATEHDLSEQNRQNRQDLLRQFEIQAVENIDTKQPFEFGIINPHSFRPGEQYHVQDQAGTEMKFIVIGHDKQAKHLITSDLSRRNFSVWTPELFDQFFSDENTGLTLEQITPGFDDGITQEEVDNALTFVDPITPDEAEHAVAFIDPLQASDTTAASKSGLKVVGKIKRSNNPRYAEETATLASQQQDHEHLRAQIKRRNTEAQKRGLANEEERANPPLPSVMIDPEYQQEIAARKILESSKAANDDTEPKKDPTNEPTDPNQEHSSQSLVDKETLKKQRAAKKREKRKARKARKKEEKRKKNPDFKNQSTSQQKDQQQAA